MSFSDTNPHSFSKLFERTAIIGKGLEMRWFHHDDTDYGDGVNGDGDSNAQTRQGKVSRMPFLRRNLSYINAHVQDTKSWTRIPRKGCQRKRIRTREILNRRTPPRNGKADTLQSIRKYHTQRSKEYSYPQLLRPFKRFPPYIPYDSKSSEWIPPHPSSTAFSLFANKVKNQKNNTTSTGNGNREQVETKAICKIWNALEDGGKFWTEEARWDQRRYKHQKTLWNNARFQTQAGHAIFSYVYFNDFGELSVQMEKAEKADRHCPFCWFNGGTDLGLMMHLRTAHEENGIGGGRRCRMIKFDAGLDAENNLHVVVKSLQVRRKNRASKRKRGHNSGRDFTFFVRDKDAYFQKLQKQDSFSEKCKSSNLVAIPFVRQPLEMTCLLDDKTRKKKVRQFEQQLRQDDPGNVHPQAPSQYIANDKTPIRQYYHSKTMQPMASGDWDIDSDDDDDNSWAQMLSECALKELGDVSTKEKKFMNIWNGFMESHTVIADRAIPSKCAGFLVANHEILIKFELRDQFLLHLMNLWDNQLVSSNKIVALMKAFDSFEKRMKIGSIGEPKTGDPASASGMTNTQKVHDEEVVDQSLKKKIDVSSKTGGTGSLGKSRIAKEKYDQVDIEMHSVQSQSSSDGSGASYEFISRGKTVVKIEVERKPSTKRKGEVTDEDDSGSDCEILLHVEKGKLTWPATKSRKEAKKKQKH